MNQAQKAELFRDLHHRDRLLILPNAWDVASALIFQNAGFPAIATTSAGIAAVFGYPDGQHIGRDLMLEMVRRIVRAVSIPVTADMEAGYDDPVRTAIAVMETGAVGMNLEDVAEEDPSTLADMRRQMQIIRDIRAKTNLVINARTDVFLAGIGDPAARTGVTIQRLNAYRDAGADCLFAPGVREAETIRTLAQAVNGPLNILAGPGTPPLGELQRLGVTRVSIGSGAMRAMLGLTRRIAEELLEKGTYTELTEGSVPYTEVNIMLKASMLKTA